MTKEELKEENERLRQVNEEYRERIYKVYGCECGRVFQLDDIDIDL